MSIKNLKCFILILIGLIILSQNNLAQIETSDDSINQKSNLIISGLHTLSIHVIDTITHDSVFHFLVDKLKLPVYYYPLTLGKRKYAGVYAGNMVLEPCGPYPSFSYAINDFRAIFFGLTFEPSKSLSLTATTLTDRDVQNEVFGDAYIYINDSLLCGDNITISIMDKHDKIKDEVKMDSLRYTMTNDSKNELGIEYVSEIWVGYKGISNLQKWRVLIRPSELINNEIWKESNITEFHFIKSNIKEVQRIVFKVKSLEKAGQYLLKNNLIGRLSENKIELDKAQAFGLSIYFTE